MGFPSPRGFPTPDDMLSAVAATRHRDPPGAERMRRAMRRAHDRGMSLTFGARLEDGAVVHWYATLETGRGPVEIEPRGAGDWDVEWDVALAEYEL